MICAHCDSPTFRIKPNAEMPVAKMINVSYVNITGGTGQADLLPAEYLQFIEPYSKEYKLTMYDYDLDRFIPYASFDSKKEAVRMCFDLFFILLHRSILM